MFFVGVSLVLFFRFKKGRDAGAEQAEAGYRRLEEEREVDRYKDVRSMELRED